MPWFYAPPERWSGDLITLPPDESHHAATVLRLSVGDRLTVIDGRGAIASGRVASRGEELGVAIDSAQEVPRPRPLLIAYQAAMKGRKLDDCVERLAEVGVAEIVVFESERAVARWDPKKKKRLELRYSNLARVVAKRARDPFISTVQVGVSWQEMVDRITREPHALVAWEGASVPLDEMPVGRAERVAFVIGPEGGLSEAEVNELEKAGGAPVSLGPRILRTESAGVVAASAIAFRLGALRGRPGSFEP